MRSTGPMSSSGFFALSPPPAVEDWADRVQAVLEPGDDAEVAAAAAQAPEQVRVLVLAGLDDLAVGEDDLRTDHAVDRVSQLALQPTGAAAQREPCDAGGGHATAGDGESVLLGRSVELPPVHAAAGERRPGLGVNSDALEGDQVDHEAALADRVPLGRVATALD